MYSLFIVITCDIGTVHLLKFVRIYIKMKIKIQMPSPGKQSMWALLKMGKHTPFLVVPSLLLSHLDAGRIGKFYEKLANSAFPS